MPRIPCSIRYTIVVLALFQHVTAQAAEALASWNDGEAKKTIVAFVDRVTRAGSTDFVEPDKRIAVFDNDGTLWAEQPIYFQFAYALDTVKVLAPQHPEWQNTQPFKAVLTGDKQALASMGERDIVQLLTVSHAGMTTEAFAGSVRSWLRHAKHPRYGLRYTDLVYQPMLELLAYMRANGFKTFIVSGGGAEFMRVFAEDVYGIPPEQVIGSSGATKFELTATGKPVLVKQAQIEFVDDGPGKPVGIHRFIGRQPIVAFGNSDGDLQMLQWTAAGVGPRLIAIVHHTDGKREYEYDRESRVGKLDLALDEAKKQQWTIVDMKEDWRAIFPDARGAAAAAR